MTYILLAIVVIGAALAAAAFYRRSRPTARAGTPEQAVATPVSDWGPEGHGGGPPQPDVTEPPTEGGRLADEPRVDRRTQDSDF